MMIKRIKLDNIDRLAHFAGLAVIVTAPALLYIFKQSAIAFLAFIASLLVLYLVKLDSRLKLGIAILDLVLIMPLVGLTNTYYLDVITQVGIYAILAIGLNVVVGFSGLLNLGYAGFYAAGAYIYAIFASSQASSFMTNGAFPISGNWFWLFLLISMGVSAIIGVLIGLPVLRVRGDYLAIITLGFGEIIRIVLNSMDKPVNITNGPKGIGPISPPEIFGIKLDAPIHYYFIVLLLFILTIIFANRLNNSRIGRAWAAIRENEIAANTMGIPLVKMKLLAFAIGASLAGMMGVIFAAKQTFVDPSSFGFMESIGILTMIIMGGMGSVSGVVIGAAAVIILQLQLLKELSNFLGNLSLAGIIHIPSQLDPAKYERLVFGLILVLMCIFRPQGILPAKRS
ncbi:MAG TPA: branched-chain amino acid ABC transporter permease, partial [Clostridia bacterium]|nr:branched-chain amino acid ABC transporter permease [Clostridia bacterium]